MKSLLIKINDQKLLIAGFLITALLTYTAYYDSIYHQFLQWDDTLYIHQNKHIHSLSFKNIFWMFTNHDQGNWHPFTWLSLAGNISLWGFNPVAFKFVNITIHLINSILIYILCIQMLRHAQENYHSNSQSIFSKISKQHLSVSSYVIATLFALHPQHVESVSWISERKDVLCGFFYLATIICYIKYRQTENKHWFSISFLMYFFALMAKPMAVTLPIVLLLLDLYPLKLIRYKNTISNDLLILLKNKISFLVLAAAVSVITILTQIPGIQGLDTLSFGSRIINACMSIYLYIFKFVYPANLSPYYPFHPWSTDPNIYSMITVSSIVLIFSYLVFSAKKYRVYFPLVVALYFIITLLPVIGIVKVGSQAAADRYTYLPMVGFYISLAAGLAILFHLAAKNFLNRLLLVSATGLYLVFTGLTTFEQNSIWRNDEALWNEAIRQYPGLADRAYGNLAIFYFNTGQFDKAKLTFPKAMALQPGNMELLEKMGKTSSLLHEDRIALYYFNQLIELYPDHPRGYTLVGDYYYTLRKLPEAKYFYNKAFEIAPYSTATLQRKALIDYLDKDIVSARKNIDVLMQIAPNDIGGLQLAAQIYLAGGETGKSKELAHRIQQLKPGDSFSLDIINNIANKQDQQNNP